MRPRVEFADWGTIDYAEALERQRELFQRLIGEKSNCERNGVSNDSFRQSGDYATLGEKNGEGVYSCVNDRAIFETAEAESPLSRKPAGWLILCEHPHVYTLGRSGKAENLLVSEAVLRERGASLYRTERGGDVTYHGPGQIVGYPILDLEHVGLGLREYIGALEAAVIETVAAFGIEAGRVPGKTGVWVNSKLRITNYELRNSQPQDGAGRGIAENEGKSEYRAELCTAGMELDPNGSAIAPEAERKICAIGVKSSRFVTMHGFALNVATDLGWFEHINPCGFVGGAVTSMERELGRRIAPCEVKKLLAERLAANLKILLG